MCIKAKWFYTKWILCIYRRVSVGVYIRLGIHTKVVCGWVHKIKISFKKGNLSHGKVLSLSCCFWWVVLFRIQLCERKKGFCIFVKEKLFEICDRNLLRAVIKNVPLCLWKKKTISNRTGSEIFLFFYVDTFRCVYAVSVNKRESFLI